MKNFADQILKWYESHQRDLPWRHTKDPYKIWLSEIIMQQTQIAQGTSYYLTFNERFPTVEELATAKEQEVLVLWQGLGYYSRARNLHFTAKEIVKKYKGSFPDNYKDLLKLKGVGDYTASAISSICFNEVRSAVDGNVLRVISRLFEIQDPINKTLGKNKIKHIVDELISKDKPGDFNQALMDFGSQVCMVKNPECQACIFSDMCSAYKNSTVNILPYKERAKKKDSLYLNYFICQCPEKKSLIVKKRIQGIWKNLYEFPKIKRFNRQNDEKLADSFTTEFNIKKPVIIKERSDEIKHVLSHKELFVKFFLLEISVDDLREIADLKSYEELNITDLDEFPFPIVIRKYLDTKFPIV